MVRRKAKPERLTARQIVDRLSKLYGRPTWRPHRDPATELVLTILSQNTSDTNSGRAFMRLVSRFPTLEALMAADPSEIEKEIKVGGLAATKAPRIKKLLEEIFDRVGSFELSFLQEMPLPDAKTWLRSLPGVGPKTAACVLMFALGLPALPVDTHVQRVAQRLGLVPKKTNAEQAHDLLEEMLAPEDVYPFHIALITHGRQTCRAQRPACAHCPLNDLCPTAPMYLATTGENRGERSSS